jgi:GH15 family glucan-1,4-alpha-glucosidase
VAGVKGLKAAVDHAERDPRLLRHRRKPRISARDREDFTPVRIEEYGLIGDLQTAALVGRDGAIDWLCLPRFDSASCFSALLGGPEHGRWLLAPAGEAQPAQRRYRPGSLVLETDFETADGAARVIDFMPRRGDGPPQVVRIVEGLGGRVAMRSELVLRPDYGAIVPWLEHVPDGVLVTAGPDAFHLSTPRQVAIADGAAVVEFHAVEGSREHFVMSWHPSSEHSPPVESADSALARTEAWWRRWSDRCTYEGAYPDAVRNSLVVLKAMTHEQTGALVAAPTTSLPEDVGGVRNWDYRYCWLRDSVLTLEALLVGGYTEEALGFRDFVFRAVSGDPSNVQIMYGLSGERRLTEFELPHLPGYEGSQPVRVGNAASEQFQLDVYGEVVGAGYAVMEHGGVAIDPRFAPRWGAIIDQVERIWREPDDGIWEARGPRRHFTHSKVMAWVAFDRAVRIAGRAGLGHGDRIQRWTTARDEIHAEVCERAWDPDRRTFTQYYGSSELDAAVLQIPIVGFLPGDDERVTGTIDAVQRELGHDGFVSRYSTAETDDGLPGTEGQFLACSFWLVSALALNGRRDEARPLFERLLALSNDLGLLAEEYDVPRGRQVGNFPQAFSHLALIQAARLL